MVTLVPIMKLKQFLIEKNLSAAEFGRLIGVRSRMTICRYVSGERMPDRSVMTKIVEVTHGAVTPNDFHGVELNSGAQAGSEAA